MAPWPTIFDARMLSLSIDAFLYVMVMNGLLMSFIALPALLIGLCVPGWRRQMLRQPRRFGALGLICLMTVGYTLLR
jgi:hypothetical protein